MLGFPEQFDTSPLQCPVPQSCLIGKFQPFTEFGTPGDWPVLEPAGDGYVFGDINTGSGIAELIPGGLRMLGDGGVTAAVSRFFSRQDMSHRECVVECTVVPHNEFNEDQENGAGILTLGMASFIPDQPAEGNNYSLPFNYGSLTDPPQTLRIEQRLIDIFTVRQRAFIDGAMVDEQFNDSVWNPCFCSLNFALGGQVEFINVQGFWR